jgi:Fur family ferric uptake transcriptional regulator
VVHRTGRPHAASEVAEREAEILDALRADGGRVTTGRRGIVRALLSSPDHHVTAEDLAAAVQAAHPEVHLSTVYRTLDALEERGVVDRVLLGSGRAVYHLTDHDHAHHHLLCGGCGAVVEVHDEDVEALRAAVRAAHGFELSGRLVLPGRCRRCQNA